MGEIMNAASDYYGWGLSNVKTIEIVSLSTQELQKFVGKYKYSEQVPGLGDYLIEVKLASGLLMVIDPEEKVSFSVVPTEAMKFVDPEKGDQIAFSENQAPGGLTLLWNNSYHFNRVK